MNHRSTRAWLLLVPALAACSGGTSPVGLVGGYDDDPGPGNPGFDGDVVGSADPSPLLALCIDACVHVLTGSGCTPTPADVDACRPICSSTLQAAPSCDDEAAAVFACVAKADASCSGGAPPTSKGCEDAEKAYEACKNGMGAGDCFRDPNGDPLCSGGLVYYQCDSNPGDCVSVGGSGYCCP